MSKKFNAHTTFYRPLSNQKDIQDFFDVVEKDDPELDKKFVLFTGRSNVGKSSLINAIFQGKIARTSKTPGRTQSINVFKYTLEKDGEERLFMDLPGFGYAKVSKEMRSQWNETFSYFFEVLPTETVIFHIQDARHPFTEVDQQFLSFLSQGEFQNILIFNKYDKLKTQKLRSALNKEIKSQSDFTAYYQQIVKCSAEKREGLEPIFDKLLEQF